MAFTSGSRLKSARSKLLVALATRNSITDHEEEVDLFSSDFFASSSYDPTYNPTFEINSSQNAASPVPNTEILFEELQEVQYQELQPVVYQSELCNDDCRFSDPVELENNDITSLSFVERVILNEVTGELIKDQCVSSDRFNNEDYYLDEKTGMFQSNSNMNLIDRDDNIISSDGEFSSSDAEQSQKQRDVNKCKRARGQKYLGRKRKWDERNQKSAYEHVMKPKKKIMVKSCNHTCISKSERSFLCGVITEEQCKGIFKYFWDLHTWEAKKAYLKNLVKLRPVLRRRTKRNDQEETQRQLAYDYYLPDDKNNLQKVCKRFLINTLNINGDTLSEWIKKLQDNVCESKDLRSKHEKRLSKRTIPNQLAPKVLKSDSVKEWLGLLNKVPSHYCRSNSSRVYVEDTFESKSHMFRVYTNWCKDSSKISAARKLFNEILEQEKISIYKPRKDQCDICSARREGNISDEEYELHIQMKNEAYKAHSDATAICSSEVLVLTIDVQSVLLCPKILVSVQYYKQKLQVHNYSIYVNNNKDVHLYVWHEGDGSVTANEFTSCIIDFLQSQLIYKKIIMISDGCSYQNRNKVLSSALLQFTKENGVEIEQIILEKGHTMMEVDSVHSTLEKKFRPPIYSPSDYVNRMREARPKQPYQVHHVDYSCFKNYEANACLDSIRPGKKAGDPTVNNIRGLLYKNGNIYYKLRHPDDWRILPQRLRNCTSSPDSMYFEPRKIDKTKYDSLQSLKLYMHRDYHAFYNNLQFKN